MYIQDKTKAKLAKLPNIIIFLLEFSKSTVSTTWLIQKLS